MVAKRLLRVILIMLISGFGLSRSQADSSDPGALMGEVLKLSGVENTLRSIPMLVRNQLASEEARLSPLEGTAVRNNLNASFTVNALYESVKAHIARNSDRERLVTTLKGLRSPLVQKITQLEAQAAAPEAAPQKSLFAVQSYKKPPTRERKALIERLDTAKGATELAVEMPVAIAQGITKTMDAVLPTAKRSKKKEIDEVVSLLRTRHRPEVKTETQLTLLFTYRSVSDDELKQYVEFLESEPAKWFNDVVSKGVIEAIGAASERSTQKITKTLSSGKTR